MKKPTDATEWLRDHAPTLWSLLTERAQRDLPAGLRDYLHGSPSEVNQGQFALSVAEQCLEQLVATCGLEQVQSAYRRDLSTTKDMQRSAELCCEAAVVARFAEFAQHTTLQPASDRGTKCEGAFAIDGHTLFVECKRYRDRWPWKPGDDEGDPPVRHRSLVPVPPESVPAGIDRPRSMDLASKLERVPLQFPTGGVNLLVVFHRSIADGWRDLQQALFGGHAALHDPPNPPLEDDGLFAQEDWNVVNAVALFEMPWRHGPYARVLWVNPRGNGLPDAIRDVVSRLAEPPASTE